MRFKFSPAFAFPFTFCICSWQSRANAMRRAFFALICIVVAVFRLSEFPRVKFHSKNGVTDDESLVVEWNFSLVLREFFHSEPSSEYSHSKLKSFMHSVVTGEQIPIDWSMNLCGLRNHSNFELNTFSLIVIEESILRVWVKFSFLRFLKWQFNFIIASSGFTLVSSKFHSEKFRKQRFCHPVFEWIFAGFDQYFTQKNLQVSLWRNAWNIFFFWDKKKKIMRVWRKWRCSWAYDRRSRSVSIGNHRAPRADDALAYARYAYNEGRHVGIIPRGCKVAPPRKGRGNWWARCVISSGLHMFLPGLGQGRPVRIITRREDKSHEGRVRRSWSDVRQSAFTMWLVQGALAKPD